MPSGREAEARALLGRVPAWASGRADLLAVALVGSWARGAAREDSDVDLVLLTDDVAAYTDRDDWVPGLGGLGVAATRTWGALTERRLVLPGGLEADVGIVPPSWARTDPVDPGTARVVRDGLEVLHDPAGQLARLLVAAGGEPAPRATPGAGLPRPTRP